MSDAGIFRGRTAAVLVAVGLAAFFGAVIAALFSGQDPDRSAGADAFSRSAIGYRALVELLHERGVPVVVSRNDSAARAGRHGLLVVAAPPPLAANDPEIKALLDAPRLLYVLPKWTGAPDPRNPGWLKAAAPLPTAVVTRALKRIAPDASVVREKGAVAWSGGNPDIAAPQLVRSARIKPLIESPRGILLGMVERGRRGQQVWLLSDPDLLANFGIGKGDNARLVADLIDRARFGGAVVFDETVHGFRLDPSLLRAMFRRPFLPVTLAAMAAVLVVVWLASGRFGAPSAAPAEAEEGKADLVRNTASLLLAGGHGGDVLLRYRTAMLRDVLRHLHPPRRLRGDALTAWLDRIGAARGVHASFAALSAEVDRLAGEPRVERGRLARAADNLYRWKQEMIHGS